MSYPKYFVTYAVQTMEAGSNPFWHTSLFMSEQATPDTPIQVKDAIGFYSELPSSTTNPIIKSLKTLLGFRIDLQDSHGHLRKEKIREIDKQGIKGISFAVTKEQYDDLIDRYTRAMQDENTAIAELNEQLSKEGYPADGHTRYLRERDLAAQKRLAAEEELAARTDLTPEERKEEELKLAKDPNLKPRLRPFHITMDVTRSGFNSSESYTCKTRVLDFLLDSGIINDEDYDKFLSSPAKSAFPRCYAVPLLPIQLISTGQPTPASVKTADGKIKTFYNRSWEKQNDLFWSQTPPLYLSSTSKTQPKLYKNNHVLIKDMLKQIDEVERLLLSKINKSEKAGNEGDKQRLTRHLEHVQLAKEKFKANNYNQTKPSLQSHLMFAQKAVNAAHIALAPHKINYTFLGRALHNLALRHALLGLLTVTLVAATITGLVGVAIAVGASLFSGYNFFKAIQTEIKLSEQYYDYTPFRQVPVPA